MLVDGTVKEPLNPPGFKIVGRVFAGALRWFPEARYKIALCDGDIVYKNGRAALVAVEDGDWRWHDVTVDYLVSKQAIAQDRATS